MKKRFVPVFVVVLLLPCFIAIESCKKASHEEPAKSSAVNDISRVKKWFYETWQIRSSNSITDARTSTWQHDTSFILNNYANLVPDWRFAKVHYEGDVKYTEVPASLPDSLQFKIGSIDSMALFGQLSDPGYAQTDQSRIFLLIREIPNQEIYAEVVTFIGDYEYTKANYQQFLNQIGYFNLTNYTGLVAYHDRIGALLRVFKYNKGQLVNTIRCVDIRGLDPAPDNRVHLDECYEILTWERECTYTYTQYTIIKECTEWFLIGSYMIGNCFSDGSSGGTSHYNPVSENGISCNSFDFRQTAGNWQEAGVKAEKYKLHWVGGGRNGVIIDITLGAPIVYGLPLIRANGQRISAAKATKIAAAAATKAGWMTTQLLKHEPYRPSDAVVEETYRRWVNLFMQNDGGTAGRTGSGSPLIVFKTAQYTFLGNGNCE